MTFKVLALVVEQYRHVIEFRTKKLFGKGDIFYHVMLQIHPGRPNSLQKNDMLDLSLIKLLQNQQLRNFYASQCIRNQ